MCPSLFHDSGAFLQTIRFSMIEQAFDGLDKRALPVGISGRSWPAMGVILL